MKISLKTIGIALILIGIGAVIFNYWGAKGLLIALGVVVLALLALYAVMLQMQKSGPHPIGHTDNATALSHKLKPGMTLLQVTSLSKSMGQRIGQTNAQPEVYRWMDKTGLSVTCNFSHGQLTNFVLFRPSENT